MKVLLCITGSISAYKGPSIANGLSKQGHEVKVVLTKSALKFITKLSFSAQGHETFIDEDDFSSNNVLHIELIDWADKVLIAPLSANTLSKIANGITDNLLTSIIRAYPFHDDEKKLILSLAMNTDMYVHPITNMHLNIIKSFFENNYNLINNSSNLTIIKPTVKILACNRLGIGALPNTVDILKHI